MGIKAEAHSKPKTWHQQSIGIKQCSSCKQYYGKIDADCLPEQEVLLEWTKKSRNPENGKREIPDGPECAPCVSSPLKSLGAIALPNYSPAPPPRPSFHYIVRGSAAPYYIVSTKRAPALVSTKKITSFRFDQKGLEFYFEPRRSTRSRSRWAILVQIFIVK